MSKGTPVVTLRMPVELREEIERAIAHRNYRSSDAPWSFSDFLAVAVKEKLKKMERSRKARQSTRIWGGQDTKAGGDQAGGERPS